MESPLCPPSDPGFRLIETFRWQPGNGVLRWGMHLARLNRSAALLGIELKGVEAAIAQLTGFQPLRVRLSIDADGMPEIATVPFVALRKDVVWAVAVADETLNSDDPWLQVKTTSRTLYDTTREHMPKGVDEAIFLNERGELCEGTITNLFVDMGGTLLTPPTSCGLLPGVLREEMLANGDTIESVMTLNTLQKAKRVYVGNSLRGLIPVQLSGVLNA